MFKDVLAKLEQSGLPDELQAMLNPHQTGAPRQVSVAVFLTALILVFRFTGSATLADLHRYLTTGLDRHLQVELGTRKSLHGRDDACGALTYRQVQYLFRQIVRRIDPKESNEVFERTRRRRFLMRLQTEYAQVLIPKDDLADVRARAVDSTPVHAWNLAWSGRDCDASTGHRTLTDSDAREFFFGFRALTYCIAGERPYVEAFYLRPANEGEIEANLDLTTALADLLKKDGRTLGYVLADRGFSELQEHNWVEPMRGLGAEPVFDYRKSDRGVVMILGALVTDGRPHCPCLPKELELPARPPRVGLGAPPGDKARQKRRDQYESDRTALEEAKKLIEQRQDYMGGHVAGNGYGHGDAWRCPALEGKVRCTRRPDSMFLPDDGRPTLRPGDDIEMGEFCTEESIVLRADVQPKLRQKFTWMGRMWRFWYRKRTYAEGVFGNLKNRRTESITRGWIRVAGLTATTLMLWAATNHYNLRIATRDADDGDYGFVDLPRPDTP
ncbi:hypothetical protein [Actinotalea subterranea]|uniref:hypothetical protein n=1 Tax=Actinotalea subterranea TaxID=2607497 RepID=UPI00165DB4B5|nr:hypothetical protein [Actinotalea subterranea]